MTDTELKEELESALGFYELLDWVMTNFKNEFYEAYQDVIDDIFAEWLEREEKE